MNMDDYLAHLEAFWHYFPYFFYTFVLLTFLPKSLRKIKQFADADYESNRGKYHRCYGPDLCCHSLIEHEDAPKATKPRKAVSRGYLRKQQSAQQLRSGSVGSEDATTLHPTPLTIKRQVPVSAIQTSTNVNQIAKMFESGNSGLMSQKKINRVLPEIRASMHRHSQDHQHDNDDRLLKSSNTTNTTSAQLQRLLHENIENSMNLLHQQTSTTAGDLDDTNWQPARRTRPVPNSLTYAGTSATPSTASPAASSPHSSPSPPNSPVVRQAPVPLNLKTSVEDIFAAIARSAEKNEEQFIYTGCNTLSPVTSIDDILSQRRLSRPLSAYSISDLLNEETNYNKTTTTTNNNNLDQTKLNGQENHNHQEPQKNVLKDENLYVENLLIATIN